VKKPKKRAPPKPRNVAAKALRSGQFQARVHTDPNAYRRRAKHRVDPAGLRDDDDQTQ
jgi:hypothetical protein